MEKAFNNKLGKFEKTLQTLLNRQGSEKSASKEQKSTETVSLPQAVMGDRSGSTPSVMEVLRGKRGCTFKDFAACKPPVFKGERDPVLALQWLGEIEIAFDTCKCVDEDRVMFVLSMLKAEAMHWWNVESRGKPSEVAKNTS